jgi:hypothetical protein
LIWEQLLNTADANSSSISKKQNYVNIDLYLPKYQQKNNNSKTYDKKHMHRQITKQFDTSVIDIIKTMIENNILDLNYDCMFVVLSFICMPLFQPHDENINNICRIYLTNLIQIARNQFKNKKTLKRKSIAC